MRKRNTDYSNLIYSRLAVNHTFMVTCDMYISGLFGEFLLSLYAPMHSKIRRWWIWLVEDWLKHNVLRFKFNINTCTFTFCFTFLHFYIFRFLIISQCVQKARNKTVPKCYVMKYTGNGVWQADISVINIATLYKMSRNNVDLTWRQKNFKKGKLKKIYMKKIDEDKKTIHVLIVYSNI